jgi:hypothetical protein
MQGIRKTQMSRNHSTEKKKTHIGEEIRTTEREIEIHPADDHALQGRINIPNRKKVIK